MLNSITSPNSINSRAASAVMRGSFDSKTSFSFWPVGFFSLQTFSASAEMVPRVSQTISEHLDPTVSMAQPAKLVALDV